MKNSWHGGHICPSFKEKALSFYCLLLLLPLWFISGCNQPAPVSIESMVSNSDYIFQGSVVKLHAVTIPIITDMDNAAIVKVIRVLDNKGNVDDFTNREITVMLHSSRKAKEGHTGIFYTKGWLYGESIAVIETGVIDQKEEDPLEVQKQILQIRTKQVEDKLTDRIRKAQTIILGNVVDVIPFGQQEKIMDREHDPEWWRATVKITQLLKGSYAYETITFLYANSMDIGWYKSPKFESGKEGIFIINGEEYKSFGVMDFVVVNPLDFQPPEQLGQMTRLINQSK